MIRLYSTFTIQVYRCKLMNGLYGKTLRIQNKNLSKYSRSFDVDWAQDYHDTFPMIRVRKAYLKWEDSKSWYFENVHFVTKTDNEKRPLQNDCDHARVLDSHLPPPVYACMEKLNRMGELKSITREMDTLKNANTYT